MKKLSISIKIYIALIILLASMAAIYIFLPQNVVPGLKEPILPAPKPVLALVNAFIMLILYGGLGFLGLKLSLKLGFSDIWQPDITNKQRFLIPMIIGIGAGLFFIISDAFFKNFHTFGPMPHPPFPTSLVASIIAGIGEELIFRLFFISFWVWLISYIILKKRWQNQIFWIISFFSAIAFSFGHVPSIMFFFNFNSVMEIPPAMLIEIILLNGVLSFFAAYYFRKYGFLASVGIHFWTDVVWHVIRGIF